MWWSPSTRVFIRTPPPSSAIYPHSRRSARKIMTKSQPDKSTEADYGKAKQAETPTRQKIDSSDIDHDVGTSKADIQKSLVFYNTSKSEVANMHKIITYCKGIHLKTSSSLRHCWMGRILLTGSGRKWVLRSFLLFCVVNLDCWYNRGDLEIGEAKMWCSEGCKICIGRKSCCGSNGRETNVEDGFWVLDLMKCDMRTACFCGCCRHQCTYKLTIRFPPG